MLSTYITITTAYNSLDFISEIWYAEGDNSAYKAYSYEYTSDGKLYKIANHISDRTTLYSYLPSGKLSSVTEYDNDELANKFVENYSYGHDGKIIDFVIGKGF